MQRTTRSLGMRRRPAPLLAVLGVVVATLASCGPTTADWNDAGVRKTNRVDLITLSHAVEFAVGEDAIPADERTRFAAFLARQSVGYGDEVYVLTGMEEQAAGALAERRRETVRHFLAAQGILPAPAALAPPSVEVPRGPVTVLVRRYVVIPPECGDWSKPPASDFSNTVSSNFGCATEANLGLMVADPGDLLVGHPAGTMNGERAALAIQRYREGETQPLPDSTTSETTSEATAGATTQ